MDQALAELKFDRTSITLPMLPEPVSTPWRLLLVDTGLADSPSVINLGDAIRLVHAPDQEAGLTYTTAGMGAVTFMGG